MNERHSHTDESLDPNWSSSSLASSWQHHELEPTHEIDKCSVMLSSHDDCEFSDDLDATDGDVDTQEIKGKNEDELNTFDGGFDDIPEPTMTLLPPPPSWFQFESEVHKHSHDEQSTSATEPTDNANIDHLKPSQHFEGDRNVSSANNTGRNAVQRYADDKQQHPPSSGTNLELSEESQGDFQLEVPFLPQYNSQEAKLFDMPVSFAYSTTHEHNTIEESVSDSISIQSAIDTLISQTLSFTSQTVSKTIPTLLHECSSSAIQKALHKLSIEYARFGPRKYLRASDLGSVGGYFRPSVISSSDAVGDTSVFQIESSVALGKGRGNHFDWMWMDGREIRFTNLPWVERQLVHEWRTYEWTINDGLAGSGCFESSFCIESSHELEHESSKEHTAVNKIDSQKRGQQAIADVNEILSEDDDEDEFNQADVREYERARTLAPRPLPRPEWEHASSCYICQKIFGPTLHRHHCRRCGHSYCNAHSNYFHQLPHLGYDRDVRERVCRGCKILLDSRDLEERVAWRLARCRDFLSGTLVPYFETGVDTVEDAAFRLTRVAIRLARSIPLGAQAYVAIETVEILRKHGLSGVYGLLLRKEFLAAADLLCRVLGINKKNWPLSVHELSAAIFYALAQHRALRGLRPDGEELIHSLKDNSQGYTTKSAQEFNANDSTIKRISSLYVVNESNEDEEEDAGDTVVWEGAPSKVHKDFSETVLDETDVYDPSSENAVDLLLLSRPKGIPLHSSSNDTTDCSEVKDNATPDSHSEKQSESHCADLPFEPVCEPVPDDTLTSLLFYAPLALNFIYAECEVDMQLLAAQQGWRLVYASLDQNQLHSDEETEGGNKTVHSSSDKPASALFAHDDKKIACLSIRGTTSVQDVVTDIRAVPVPFPQEEEEEDNEYTTDDAFSDYDEWTSVFRGKGLASCGMAGAALNLFKENADSLTHLARNGYRIRIVGHSLGGGVASLLGILMSHHLEKLKVVYSETDVSSDDRLLRVYGYGTPSCVDGRLADYTRAYAINVVLHDDVVPRLTPTSIRSLLKHLLHIRETWVKAHLSDDLKCYNERALKVWPSRVRESFSLSKKVLKKTTKKLKKSYKKRMQKDMNIIDDRQDIESTEFLGQADVVVDEDRPNEVTDIETDSVGEGLDVEGDLFFDALNDEPLNESDDESSIGRARPARVPSNAVLVEYEDEWVPFDEPPMTESNDNNVTETSNDCEDEDLTSTMDTSPQILEELPLPRMFVPGKIVHIYTSRGGYKAAFVPRKFKSLRRISMAGNCLTDHMSKSYYESMLEVKTIRSAKYDLPQWVGFDQDCTCACCASLFTWASTSNTEAQAARDKHNCRSCGSLVCDPCSKNKVPIPSIGINQSVRVCDRCYYGWGSLYKDTNDKNNQVGTIDADGSLCQQIKSPTLLGRRSQVVDELAARLPTVR